MENPEAARATEDNQLSSAGWKSGVYSEECQQVCQLCELERDHLAAILETVPHGIVIVEKPNGKITYVNSRAIELYGTDPRGLEMVSHSPRAMRLLTLDGDIYPSEELPANRALLRGENVRYEEMVIEQPGGKRAVVTVSASPLRNENGEIVAAVGIFDDITERKQIEEELRKHREELEDLVRQRTEEILRANRELEKERRELRQAEKRARDLAVRLVGAQEKERRELGQELHDGVGGSLTLLKIAAARARQTPPDQIEAVLEEIERVADEVYEQVRALSHGMRPGMLDDVGLVDALSSYFEDYTAQTGVKVSFEHRGLETPMATDTEIAAFRIVQEALVNAARHAKTSHVTVRLECEHTTLRLEIEDRGCGFDPTEVDSRSSGISGMQYRAQLAGGELVVDSSPGAGTCVSCRLPLRERSEAS